MPTASSTNRSVTVSIPPKGKAGIKTYFPNKPVSRECSYSSRFFKGVEEVKKSLVGAIRSATEDRKYKKSDLDELDKRCSLGAQIAPTCEQLFANPNLLTTAVFARLSFELGIKVDQVLTAKLKKEDIATVAAEMRRKKLGVKATSGGSQRLIPSPEEENHVQLFIAISAFREIDLKFT